MSYSRINPTSQRQLRVNEMLRHAIAEVIDRETFLNQDLAGLTLTITEVNTSPDLKYAEVYITRLGGGDMETVLRGLKKVKSFIKREIGKKINLRYLPELRFREDKTFEEVKHIEYLLNQPKVRKDIRTKVNEPIKPSND